MDDTSYSRKGEQQRDNKIRRDTMWFTELWKREDQTIKSWVWVIEDIQRKRRLLVIVEMNIRTQVTKYEEDR